jgi:hypothetical protein
LNGVRLMTIVPVIVPAAVLQNVLMAVLSAPACSRGGILSAKISLFQLLFQN